MLHVNKNVVIVALVDVFNDRGANGWQHSSADRQSEPKLIVQRIGLLIDTLRVPRKSAAPLTNCSNPGSRGRL